MDCIEPKGSGAAVGTAFAWVRRTPVLLAFIAGVTVLAETNSQSVPVLVGVLIAGLFAQGI